jgi:hypothetical protein
MGLGLGLGKAVNLAGFEPAASWLSPKRSPAELKVQSGALKVVPLFSRSINLPEPIPVGTAD